MARLARVVVPGYPHHITQRGNRRQKVFFRESDYSCYLDLLREWCVHENIEIWAYCLMTNHVHLIVTPNKYSKLGRAIGETHRRYTRMICRTTKRLGIELTLPSHAVEGRDREGAGWKRMRERQLVQWQIRIEVLVVTKSADRNARVADRMAGQRMIRIDRRHRWRITNHIHATSALGDQLAELFVGTSRRPLTR